MSDGVSVDACVMALFAKSLLPVKDEAKVPEARQLVDRIRSTIGFAIDDGRKIETQWLNTCGSKSGIFREWYVQSIKDGKIKQVVPALSEQHKKKLRIDCGFPNDQFECTYIAVANSTSVRYIVSEDMHFFEPKHKKANEKAKYRSREERKGSVCRYLREKMKIRVGTIDHAAVELWVEKKQCPEGDNPDGDVEGVPVDEA